MAWFSEVERKCWFTCWPALMLSDRTCVVKSRRFPADADGAYIHLPGGTTAEGDGASMGKGCATADFPGRPRLP
jgi:hypothetical protein